MQKRKAPKLNPPPPPCYTENLVTMYNKYGALDTEEGMESDAAGNEDGHTTMEHTWLAG